MAGSWLECGGRATGGDRSAEQTRSCCGHSDKTARDVHDVPRSHPMCEGSVNLGRGLVKPQVDADGIYESIRRTQRYCGGISSGLQSAASNRFETSAAAEISRGRRADEISIYAAGRGNPGTGRDGARRGGGMQ
jgi:hypothetical protein